MSRRIGPADNTPRHHRQGPTTTTGRERGGARALDAAAAAGGAHAPWLSLAALVLAPGWRLPAAALPCPPQPGGDGRGGPVLGLAASSVALVSAASGGVALHGVPIRFLLAALVVIGFLLPWPGWSGRPGVPISRRRPALQPRWCSVRSCSSG